MGLEQNIRAAHRATDDAAADLLERLGEAHSGLAQALAAMERITSQPVDRPALDSARWRLSAANRARRAVCEECWRYLVPLADRRTAEALADLKARDIAMARS